MGDGPVDLVRRLRERTVAAARARRVRRSVRVGVALGVVAVLAGAAWVVLASPWLTVEAIEVDGVDGRLAAQVREAAETELGTPLARVDLGAVRDRVAEVPQVAEVDVDRAWPRTLRLTVQRRVPAAYVPGTGEDGAREFEVVDRTGVVVSRTTARPKDLPRVSAPRTTSGDLEPERVADALAVLSAAPPKVRRRAVEVQARTRDDVRLVLDDGVEVHWGSAADLPRKSQVLAALLKQRARVYDVSAPDLPTTRF